MATRVHNSQPYVLGSRPYVLDPRAAPTSSKIYSRLTIAPELDILGVHNEIVHNIKEKRARIPSLEAKRRSLLEQPGVTPIKQRASEREAALLEAEIRASSSQEQWKDYFARAQDILIEFAQSQAGEAPASPQRRMEL